jgi:hypothetical protein
MVIIDCLNYLWFWYMGRINCKRKRAQIALLALGSLAYSVARCLRGPSLQAVLMSYEVLRDRSGVT